ncbi:MAG: superoxide dismutase family protein [Bacteroidota bacterium]
MLRLCLSLLLAPIAANAQPAEAVARLAPVDASGVTGQVVAQRVGEGTRLIARIDGLAPGEYGFHVVDATDCAAVPAAPTFDTQERPHGGPLAPLEARRPGDLGNLRIRHRDPVGRYDRIVPDLPFDRALGLAVVVRAGVDDLHTQPLGNAGPAVACGLIEVE